MYSPEVGCSSFQIMRGMLSDLLAPFAITLKKGVVCVLSLASMCAANARAAIKPATTPIVRLARTSDVDLAATGCDRRRRPSLGATAGEFLTSNLPAIQIAIISAVIM